MEQALTDQDVRASLSRDAALMRELRRTEMWDCIQHQLEKMEAQAIDKLLTQSVTIDEVNYWRGRLAAVREFKNVPDLIIGWSEIYGANPATNP